MFPAVVQPGVLMFGLKKSDQNTAVSWTRESATEELGANSREQKGSMSSEVLTLLSRNSALCSYCSFMRALFF